MKTNSHLKNNHVFISIFLAFLFTSCASSKYALGDYDTNGDGKLSQEEFSQTLDDTNAFQLADDDDNGSVSENEWNQYLAAINFNTKYDADDKGSFKIWDSNNNGTLSKDELYNGIFETVDNGANSNDNDTINNNIANNGFIERDEWNQWYDKDMF